MFAVGAVQVHDLSEPAPLYSSEHRIGFSDNDYVYLIPGVTYGEVRGHYGTQDTAFPIGRGQLWKRLAEAKIIDSWGKDTTKPKHIPGVGTQRVVWIRKSAVPGLFSRKEASGGFEV